jgi:hypothetical protein
MEGRASRGRQGSAGRRAVRPVRRRAVQGRTAAHGSGHGQGAARIPWRSQRACHLGTGRVRWEGAGRRVDRGTAEGGRGALPAARRPRGFGRLENFRVPLFARVKLQKVE